MVELGIDVCRFGGGVESVAGVESMAGVLVVGLVYGSVSAGVGHGRGFQIAFQVVGFLGVGLGFDYGHIWFAIWEMGMIVVVTSVGLVFGLKF